MYICSSHLITISFIPILFHLSFASHMTNGATRQRQKTTNKMIKRMPVKKVFFHTRFVWSWFPSFDCFFHVFGVCGAVVSKNPIKCFLIFSTAFSLMSKLTGCGWSRRSQLQKLLRSSVPCARSRGQDRSTLLAWVPAARSSPPGGRHIPPLRSEAAIVLSSRPAGRSTCPNAIWQRVKLHSCVHHSDHNTVVDAASYSLLIFTLNMLASCVWDGRRKAAAIFISLPILVSSGRHGHVDVVGKGGQANNNYCSRSAKGERSSSPLTQTHPDPSQEPT